MWQRMTQEPVINFWTPVGLGMDTSSGGGEGKTLISKDYTQVWYHVKSLTVCDKKGVQ